MNLISSGVEGEHGGKSHFNMDTAASKSPQKQLFNGKYVAAFYLKSQIEILHFGGGGKKQTAGWD